MGLRDKIKRRLPIIGGQRTPPPSSAAPRPRPPASDFKPEWEAPTSPRGDKPVAEFLAEFTSEEAWSKTGYLRPIGLVPMLAEEREKYAEVAKTLTPMDF